MKLARSGPPGRSQTRSLGTSIRSDPVTGVPSSRSMRMSEHQSSIDVRVPVRTAYDQWTQFETFPQFMEGVETVQQVTDTRLHWVAKIGGMRREWDAEITEQRPDQRVA